MARYQLKKKCLFVEAKVYDKTHWLPTDVKKPDDIKSAHLLDKSTKPATYLKLNDGGLHYAFYSDGGGHRPHPQNPHFRIRFSRGESSTGGH